MLGGRSESWATRARTPRGATAPQSLPRGACRVRLAGVRAGPRLPYRSGVLKSVDNPFFHGVVTTRRPSVAEESGAWERGRLGRGAVIVMGMLRPRRIRRRLRCMKKGHDWYDAPMGAYQRCYRCGAYR